MELLVERSGGVTHFVLNRPDAYNAIDAALRDQLLDALDVAESDGTTCIVLRGQGRGFCAGMDLRAGGANRGVDLAQAMARSSSRLTERILRTSVPIVSAVHGACAGLGLTLALAADHCVAAEDARFVAAFVRPLPRARRGNRAPAAPPGRHRPGASDAPLRGAGRRGSMRTSGG